MNYFKWIILLTSPENRDYASIWGRINWNWERPWSSLMWQLLGQWIPKQWGLGSRQSGTSAPLDTHASVDPRAVFTVVRMRPCRLGDLQTLLQGVYMAPHCHHSHPFLMSEERKWKKAVNKNWGTRATGRKQGNMDPSKENFKERVYVLVPPWTKAPYRANRHPNQLAL